jgi:hypothetical protein
MLFQVLADYTQKILASHYAFKNLFQKLGFFFFFFFLVVKLCEWWTSEDDETTTKLGWFKSRICHSYYQ